MGEPPAGTELRASAKPRSVGFVPARLRAPEWALGVSALALGLLLRAGWYLAGEPLPGARRGRDGTTDRVISGWRALRRLRWALLLSSLGGSAACLLQASRRAPALPVAATVLVMVEAAATAPFVFARVALCPPGLGVRPRAAAWSGLVCALAVPASAYWSLRCDGIRGDDGPREIETVALPSTAAAMQAR